MAVDPLNQEDLDELDAYFEEEFGGSSNDEDEESSAAFKKKLKQKQLKISIAKLGKQKKIPMSSNVLEHYEALYRKKEIDEDIYNLAMTVLSAPATQVSVERSFSALGIVMEPHRINLKGDNIDNILICALNRELLGFADYESM